MDDDLQAALDASAQLAASPSASASAPAAANPNSNASSSTAASASASNNKSTVDEEPLQFGSVSQIAEFTPQCTGLLKRLADSTSNSYVELVSVSNLLRSLVSGTLGEEATRYVIKDFLLPATNSVLSRTYAQEDKDMQLVMQVLGDILAVIAQHQQQNLPLNMAPLPSLADLPIQLLIPPPVPALTLPPIVLSSSNTSASAASSGSSSSSSSSNSASTTSPQPGATITIDGIPMPVAFPVQGPANQNEGAPQLAATNVAASPESQPGESKAIPAIVVNEEKLNEEKKASDEKDKAAASSSSTSNLSMEIVIDKVVNAPHASFFDIARTGSAAVSPIPSRTVSPAVGASTTTAAPTSASPNHSAVTPTTATAAPPTLNNRDLDQTVMEVLDVLLDDCKSFYKHYGSKRPDSDPLFQLPPELEPTSEAIASFAGNLKLLDWCDVSQAKDKSAWRCGQLSEERGGGEDGAVAEWRVFYEGQSDTKFEWIPKADFARFAPLYSRVGLLYDRWRFDLAPGDLLDAADYVGKWYTAKVLDTRGPLVHISYDGWSSGCNEWLCRTSQRLDRYRSKAVGGKETGGISGPYAERKYNEMYDRIETTATFRGKEWGSYYLIQVMEVFQSQHQGFDLLIQRFVHRHGASGQQASMSIGAIRKMVEALARVTVPFSKQFAQRYLPLLRLAVCETLLGLNDIELRGLSKEHLEEILKSLERLLHRIHPSKDVTAFLESFALECAYKRFKCAIVERRINGMSFITEYAQATRRTYATTWLTSQHYVEWLQRKQILAECFGESGHPELMRKSSDLIRFIAVEQRLETTHLDLIWQSLETSMKRADDTRVSIIFKILDDVAWNLTAAHISYLFHRVRTDIPLKEYTVGTLDLVKELTRFTHRAGPEASQHALDLLWLIIQDDSGATDEIKHAARSRLEDIGVQQKNQRLHFLEKCVVENLKKHTSIPQTLSFMQKLIDSFPEVMPTYSYSGNSGEDQTRNHVIMYLNDQFGLFAALFEDMTHFKQQALEKIRSHHPNDMLKNGVKGINGINSFMLNSKTVYLKHCQDRLNFMQYLLVNSNHVPAPSTQSGSSSSTSNATTSSSSASSSPPPVVNPALLTSAPVGPDPSLAGIPLTVRGPPKKPPPSPTTAARALAEQEKQEQPATAGKESNPQPEGQMSDSAVASVESTTASVQNDTTSTDSPVASENLVAVAPGGPPVLPSAANVSASASTDPSTTEAASTAPASASSPPPTAPSVTAAPPPPPPGLKLSREQVDLLWQTFYVDSLSSAERESFLRWLRNSCVPFIPYQAPAPTSSYSYVPPAPPQMKSYFESADIQAHVFDDMLLKHVDPAHIELSFYLCFQQCFLAQNQREKTLEIKPQTPNSSYSSNTVDAWNYLNADFTVLDFLGLRGFDALWRICFETPQGIGSVSSGTTEVVSKAIEFLNKIYSPTNLSEQLLDSTKESTQTEIHGIANIRLHYIEQCIATFQKDLAEKKKRGAVVAAATLPNPHRASRCLYLLHHLLDASENLKGLGGLRSHGTATRGRKMKLFVNHHASGVSTSMAKKILQASKQKESGEKETGNADSSKDADAPPARQFVTVFSNDTLFDLRSLLSKELLIPLDLIKLFIAGRPLGPNLNRMHLHELHIKDQQSILVSRKQQVLNKVDLIDKEKPDKPMVPLFRAAISDIFFRFAQCENKDVQSFPQKTMTRHDMALYIVSCGAGESSANDDRLGSIFKKYAPPGWTNHDELTVDGFCAFYQDACNDRVDNVWSDLRVHGYRHDLRKEADVLLEEGKLKDDPKYKEEESKVLPRYLLASNNSYFTLLFQALLENQSDLGGHSLVEAEADDESHAIASLTWSLLQRLPSNQELYENLSSLDVIKVKGSELATSAAGFKSWDELLDSRNVYKLLYALQILESLTEPIHVEKKQTPTADTSATNATTPVEPNSAEGSVPTASPSTSTATPSAVDPVSQAQEETDLATLLKQRDEWSRKFLNSGGFQHLYRILVESHLFEESEGQGGTTTPLTRSLRKKCLTLLLKMLYHYLFAAMNHQAYIAAAASTSLAAAGLSFVARIRSESTDMLSPAEAAAEARAIELERQHMESELRAQGGFVPQFGPQMPTGPFVNGNGPIVNPSAPPAPSLDGFSSGMVKIEEVKSDDPSTIDAASIEAASCDELPRADQLALARQMSDGFSNAVLNSVDFSQLQLVIWQIITLAADANHAPEANSPKSALPNASPSPPPSNALSPSNGCTSLSGYGLYGSSSSASSSAAAASASEDSLSSYAVATSAGTEYDQVNPELAEPALNCLVNILIYDAHRRSADGSLASKSSLLSQFYDLVSNQSNAQFFKVLFDPSTKLRKFFANTVLQICTRVKLDAADKAAGIQPPQTYFLDLMLSHLPSGTSNGAESEDATASLFTTADCSEYFWLLGHLIQNRIRTSPARDHFSGILQSLLSQLRAHSSIEVPDLTASTSNTLVNPNASGNLAALTSPKVDKIMCGLLGVIDDILTKVPELRVEIGQGDSTKPTNAAGEHQGFLFELFFQFLFHPPLPPQKPIDPLSTEPIDFPTPPKCQTKQSRSVAFSLLTTLCTDCPENFKQLFRFIQAQQTAIQLRMKPSNTGTTSTSSVSSSLMSSLDYNPANVMISSSGYVGLRNLGSTCYMNSLLQQFFMIPAFRYGILQCRPTKLIELQSKGQPEALADHLLFQLQNLFGSLSISQKQAADTSAFCKSYKDENGQPINPRIQQDTQEFFNVLVDRIEFALKTDPTFSKLLNNLFEGKLINQMICHGGCNSVRETQESYMTLSLEVKGKQRMEESLKAYVEGEVLNGINCEVCKKKVSETTKRVCLGHLPHSLFFHLKRFELNFETFQNVKLNNRFEFPLVVDLEPYTKEGVARIEAEKKHATDPSVIVPQKYALHPKEYYEYSLFGVLVHTGSAQSGHYYSFIRERSTDPCAIAANGSSPATSHVTNGKWYEFNDRDIRSFDLKDLDEQCFGGESSSSSSEKSSWGIDSFGSEKIKNAYMLCYEREGQYKYQHNDALARAFEQAEKHLQLQVAQPTAVASPAAATNGTASPAPSSAYPQIDGIPSNFLSIPLSQVLPQRIQSQVLQDNAYFMEERFIFSQEYYKFMGDILKQSKGILKESASADTSDSQQFIFSFIRLATTFLLDTLVRSADSKVVTDYMATLGELFANNSVASAWFIDFLSTGGNAEQTALPLEQRKPPSPQLLVELLLATREAYVRKAVLNLIMVCLKQLLQSERQSGLWDVAAAGPWGVEVTSRSRIQRYFLLHHSQLAETAPKNWVRFAEYLEFYFLFAQLTGIEGRRFMLAQGVATALADMYLQDSSPLADKNKKRTSMGNMVNAPSFGYLLQTLSLLSRTCYLPSVMRVLEVGQDQVEVKLPIPPTLLPDALIQDETATEQAATNESDVASPPPPAVRAQAFSPLDYQLLTTKELFSHAFMNNADADYLIPMAIHMSFENLNLSYEVINIIIGGVHKSDATNVKPYFDLMAASVAINDSVQQARFDKLLAPSTGVLHSLYVYRDHSPRFTYVSIKFLCRIMTDTPAFAKKMMEIRPAAWIWIDKWLHDYANKKPMNLTSASSSGVTTSTTTAAPTEARAQAYALYCSIVEANGSTINLDPPPIVMIGDSKGNITASSSVSSSAAISNPESVGREMLPNGSISSAADGDAGDAKKEFVAAGFKIDPNYIPKSSNTTSNTDDEFDADDANPTLGPLPLTRHRQNKGNSNLRIGVPGGVSDATSDGQAISNAEPGMSIDGNTGVADDVDGDDDDEEMASADAIPGDEVSDDKSSSYRARSGTGPQPPSTNGNSGSGEIACGICTYLNPHFRVSCEMCSSPLNGSGMD